MTRARPDLRLIVITDSRLAGTRGIFDVVTLALAAGAPAIQLRDKNATARELFEQTGLLLPIVRRHDALLFVNDRVDVAILAGADGVHLGPDDLPVEHARRIAPANLLIGYSTDDEETARTAERHGADYIGCGAVFGTTTKETGGERTGTEQLDRVARAVRVPVVGIGGVTVANVGAVARTAAAGVAVVGAVMAAADPAAATLALLAAFPGTTDTTP